MRRYWLCPDDNCKKMDVRNDREHNWEDDTLFPTLGMESFESQRETELIENEAYVFQCRRCGMIWDTEWDVDVMEAMEFQDAVDCFRETFTRADWCELTPTDKRVYFCQYVDDLHNMGLISTWQVNNWDGHPEG